MIKKLNAAIVLKELKIRNVAIHSFLKGRDLKASLKAKRNKLNSYYLAFKEEQILKFFSLTWIT